MREIQVRDKFVHIHSLTGTIAGYNQHVETHVHGSGGGGRLHKGTGTIDEINISSTNVLVKHVFVEDSEGRTHSLNLTGWDVPIMQGHRISLVWMMDREESSGPYVALKNLTTNQYLIKDEHIKNYCRPPWQKFLGVFAGAGAVLFLLLFGFSWVITGAVLGTGAGAFVRGFAYTEAFYNAMLTEVKMLLT